jgi:hypothetical protein
MMDLFKVEQLHNQIIKKEEHVLWLRSIVDNAKSPRLTKGKVQTSIDPDRLSRVMAEVIDEEHELEDLKQEYLELQVKVENKINLLDYNLMRSILRMKYLDFKTLVDISADLGYSYDYIRRMHKKAVQQYKKNDR